MPHIVSIVFNKVEGDSRVIKTAQAALAEGWNATIIGVTSAGQREELEVEGVRVVRLPNFAGTLKKLGLWGQKRDLRLLIGGQAASMTAEVVALNPDLVHSHDMIGLKLGASAVKAMQVGGRSIPWIHDLHEFVAGLKGELAEAYVPVCLAWERELLHQADALFTVSDSLAQTVSRRYGMHAPPTVVYNAPSQRDFSDKAPDLRSALELDCSVPLVVFVGGATALRGCPTIVEATARLENVHLAFVSQGQYVEEMALLAQRLGMSDRFHVHPYVPSNEVTSFIRSADMGIHGLVHYPNAEVALPNKLFEYLHAGLPVAVSDVATMKAFVEKHDVGRWFAAEDPESCAAAISAVLSHRARLKGNISAELLSHYSWEKQAEKVADKYRSLLNRRPLEMSAQARLEASIWEKTESTLFESIYARSLAERAASEVGQMKLLASIDSGLKKQAKILAQLPQSGRVEGYWAKFRRYGPKKSILGLFRKLGLRMRK